MNDGYGTHVITPDAAFDGKWCLLCGKGGHMTTECSETHLIESLPERETMRLVQIAQEKCGVATPDMTVEVELAVLRDFFDTWSKMHEAFTHMRMWQANDRIKPSIKFKEVKQFESIAQRYSGELVELCKEIKGLRGTYLPPTEEGNGDAG